MKNYTVRVTVSFYNMKAAEELNGNEKILRTLVIERKFFTKYFAERFKETGIKRVLKSHIIKNAKFKIFKTETESFDISSSIIRTQAVLI